MRRCYTGRHRVAEFPDVVEIGINISLMHVSRIFRSTIIEELGYLPIISRVILSLFRLILLIFA